MQGKPAYLLCLVFSAAAGYLGATQGFGSAPVIVFILAILLIAYPSLRAFVNKYGLERGLLALLLLGAFALFVESIGVVTGYPYGSFAYTGDLGWRVLGLVPWTVPFAWVPLLLGSLSLSGIKRDSMVRGSLRAAALLTGMDLLLDPAAVSVGLWRYTKPGIYYGIPWTNFAGWLLVGAVASVVLNCLSDEPITYSHEMTLSAACMMAFWSAVALVNGLWIPAVIGFIFLIFMGYRYAR
jgi:putative membrane protein